MLDNLKFGKIDASRYQEVAQKYRVDGSSWSKQLPTIIMFENGKEKMRRPYVDYKGNVQKFFFNEVQVYEYILKPVRAHKPFLCCFTFLELTFFSKFCLSCLDNPSPCITCWCGEVLFWITRFVSSEYEGLVHWFFTRLHEA